MGNTEELDNLRAELRSLKSKIAELEGKTPDDLVERVKEAVRKSEERYRTVFENTGTAMNIIEKDGTISLANEKFSELAGYSLREIQNKKTWMEFVVPDDLQRMRELLVWRKIMRKALIENEFRFVNKDGGIRNIHFTIDFIPGTDQRVASLLDITGHKEKEKELIEQEKFVTTVMDNLPVGIAVNSVFPEVKALYMNDNFSRIYRTTREDLMRSGNFWKAVYEDPGFRSEIRKRVEGDIASGDPRRMRWENIPITREGRETRYITAYNTPLPEKDLWISMVIDVTEQNQAEQALREMKANLEVLVEEQTRELKDKVSELERFHEATIDREFRIKELRDEVENLRQEPEKDNSRNH